MQKQADPLKILPKFSQYVEIRITEIRGMHEVSVDEEITVGGLDRLIADTLELSDIVDGLDEIRKTLNKAIMSLESRAGGYLKVLARDGYDSPNGKALIQRKWRVGMPQGDEDKMALFEWMKDKGIFEKYATVNSRSLNALFMAEWEAAKKVDPEMGVLFSMPGVPDPNLDEYTEIKPLRGSRSKRKEEANDD